MAESRKPGQKENITGRKRGNSVINSLAAVEEEKVVPVARPRLIHESSSIYEDKKDNKYQPQCHTTKMTNSYVRFVSSFMHPQPTHLPYGYKAEEGRVPFDRINALGLLLHPLRRPLVAAEKWSPYEVAVFEASIMVNGKDFPTIQKHVKTKTVKEVIEFYYDWKKTEHYQEWKKSYSPDERVYMAKCLEDDDDNAAAAK